jgi:hypothetical protein
VRSQALDWTIADRRAQAAPSPVERDPCASSNCRSYPQGASARGLALTPQDRRCGNPFRAARCWELATALCRCAYFWTPGSGRILIGSGAVGLVRTSWGGAKAPRNPSTARGLSVWSRRDESAARIPILIIYVVPTIRCIAAGALTGCVRVHAAPRRSRIGGARCCSASCATSSRSAAGATGATTSRSAASATALCQRGRTDGDCCKQRKSGYFSYRHAGFHAGVCL